MNIRINGELRELEDGSSVHDLLVHFKLDHKILVVELNRSIVDSSVYGDTRLSEGDQVEIVHFVGGG